MPVRYQTVLDEAIQYARTNSEGAVADYIPELASVNPERVCAAIRLVNGECFFSGDCADIVATLQSSAKLVLLIGLLEEMGPEQVFSWVSVEPSGDDFNSIVRLAQFGPVASNPMVNSGAITLCNFIPGILEEQMAWLERWMSICFGEHLHIDNTVFASEKRTGDRNRSLAYLLKSNKGLTRPVDEVLELYFASCSFTASVKTASYLPMLLANAGRDPSGKQIISFTTVKHVLAIMTTCGLYNEAGTHLVKTGMPAKSGVSGFILSVALGNAGIAAFSPRVNRKGTSIRSEMILEYLSNAMRWHFADRVSHGKHNADCG